MASSEEKAETSGTSRLLKAIGVLLGVHLEVAQREASRDLGRIVAGGVLLVVALVLVVFCVAFAHGAGIVWLHHARGFSWTGALLVVAAGDALVSCACFLSGRARLRKPILAETRGLVRKTVSALSE